MATSTTNLNLTKPGPADSVDIGVINGNMDILDAAYQTLDGLTKTFPCTAVANGTDLNDLTPGLYCGLNSSNASSLINGPGDTNGGYALFCLRMNPTGGTSVQIYCTGAGLYFRRKLSSGWQPWVTAATFTLDSTLSVSGAAADAAAVGTELNAKFGFRQMLNSSYEGGIDAVTAPGVYYWTSNNAPSGSPTTKHSKLLVVGPATTGTTGKMQIIYTNDGKQYIRNGASSSWESWYVTQMTAVQ